MSQFYLEQIGAAEIEEIRNLASDRVSRHEFERVYRFSSDSHAKGASIASRLTQLILSGETYRRPIFSVADVGRPSAFAGFIEGLVPTQRITTEAAGDKIQTAFNGLRRTFASLVEYEPLHQHRGAAESMLKSKLHTIVTMRNPLLGVAGVELVLAPNELSDLEQDFSLTLPAVRLNLVSPAT